MNLNDLSVLLIRAPNTCWLISHTCWFILLPFLLVNFIVNQTSLRKHLVGEDRGLPFLFCGWTVHFCWIISTPWYPILRRVSTDSQEPWQQGDMHRRHRQLVAPPLQMQIGAMHQGSNIFQPTKLVSNQQKPTSKQPWIRSWVPKIGDLTQKIWGCNQESRSLWNYGSLKRNMATTNSGVCTRGLKQCETHSGLEGTNRRNVRTSQNLKPSKLRFEIWWWFANNQCVCK